MEQNKFMIVLEEKNLSKTRQNIFDYIEKQPKRNGKPAWKDIWITMTINSLNYSTVIPLHESGRIKSIK